MATNGRCIAFLENLVTLGVPEKNIDVHITDVSVIISCNVDFVLHCYSQFSSKPITDVRSICHKFPMELDDPVFKGFRHKSRGEQHHIAVLLAPEVFGSKNMQELKRRGDMHILVWHLRQLFSAFQPVSDRSRLHGKCRKRSEYDRPRLMVVTQFFGLTWGFQSRDLVEQYRNFPAPERRKRSRPGSEPATLEKVEIPDNNDSNDKKKKGVTRTKPVPFFGIKMPRYREGVSIKRPTRGRQQRIVPVGQQAGSQTQEKDLNIFNDVHPHQEQQNREQNSQAPPAADLFSFDPFIEAGSSDQSFESISSVFDEDYFEIGRCPPLDPYAFSEFDLQE